MLKPRFCVIEVGAGIWGSRQLAGAQLSSTGSYLLHLQYVYSGLSRKYARGVQKATGGRAGIRIMSMSSKIEDPLTLILSHGGERKQLEAHSPDGD